MERMAAVSTLLSSRRFVWSNESMLQRGIYQTLLEAGHVVQREKRLSRKDRPDFMLEGGVYVEVKVDGSLTSVMRQLSRYAEQPSVSAIVLVTTRAAQAARVPTEFSGKPVRVVLLAGAFA